MAKPLVTLIIERARALIDNPATWCQGTFALRADGRRCEAHETSAVRFCAYGALQRVAFDLTGKRALAEEFAQRAAVAITGRSAAHARAWIIQTNDSQGREAVLELFDQHLGAPAAEAKDAPKAAAPRRKRKVAELVH
jgi:hypothetical protein